jgi:hypothetical protein
MGEAETGLLVVGAVVVALVAITAVLLTRFGGLRSAMFGARVEHEVGEVAGDTSMFGRGLRAKVFALAADGAARRVGLEFRHHGKRSYAVLSARDAQQLAELLQRAAR